LCVGLGATCLARPQDSRNLALAVASFEDAWQTINDTFYDPAFGGVDWPAVRRELLPRARASKSAEGVRDVIREMIGRLGQSHFELISDSTALPGPASVPIEIRVLRPDVVITRVTNDAAATAGLRPGQVILALDGVAAGTWRTSAAGKHERARDLQHWESAYRALHGAKGARAVLRVREPDGREREVTVIRDTGSRPLLQFGNILMKDATLTANRVRTPGGKDVGVIAFNLWMTAVSEPFARAVDEYRGADAIVIDLRGNPGGLAGMNGGFSGHFIAEADVVLGTMRTREAKLEFRNNPRLATDDGRRVTPFAGPVAILVDEQTASASETFSGALQALGRARIFGRQTMGQALPASTHTLPNGDVLLHAVGDFITSKGKSLEGEGVVPDEIVPLSIPALAAGRDGVLEAALSWIDRAGSLLLCSVDPQDRVFLPRCDAPDAPLKQARPEDRGRVARRSTGSSVGSY
jgi:carboxyl-terminal processing protease